MSEDITTIEILEEQHGQRIDKALADLCPDLSRSRIQSLIKDQAITLNGRSLDSASVKVKVEDIVELTMPEMQLSEALPENIPLEIIYEDDDLIVINKPAGLVVHPGAGNWTGTLVNALLYHCGDNLSGIGGVLRPGIVHRLDKETSGLMLVAKNDKAHQNLSDQLKDKSLYREYIALVLKAPVPLKGKIDQAIGRDPGNRLKMSTRGRASKEAVTHYHILENFNDHLSLVQCRLETGRTHQIRVHMNYIGHPVIGDPLYGPPKSALNAALKKLGLSDAESEDVHTLNRQALHAKAIGFIHPRTGKEVKLTSRPPEDLCKVLNLFNK